MPCRPKPQSVLTSRRSGSMWRRALRTLHLERAMADHPDAHFPLLADGAPDVRQLAAAAVGALEGEHVDVEAVEGGQGGGGRPGPGLGALGGGVAPAGMAPHLGPRAEATDLSVEGLDEEV